MIDRYRQRRRKTAETGNIFHDADGVKKLNAYQIKTYVSPALEDIQMI